MPSCQSHAGRHGAINSDTSVTYLLVVLVLEALLVVPLLLMLCRLGLLLVRATLEPPYSLLGTRYLVYLKSVHVLC